MARTIPILLLAALLGACAPMAWTRPGTDAATLEADRAECRAIAQRQARSLAFRYQTLHPYALHRWRHGRLVHGDPFGYGTLDRLFGDPTFIARDLEGDCLRAKGYALTPVRPAG